MRLTFKNPVTQRTREFETTRLGFTKAIDFLVENNNLDYSVVDNVYDGFLQSLDWALGGSFDKKPVGRLFFAFNIHKMLSDAHLLDDYIRDAINSVIKNEKDKIFKFYAEFNVIRFSFIDYSVLNEIMPDFIWDYNGDVQLKQYCFRLGGVYYPKSFKPYIRVCKECGDRYLDQDALLDVIDASKVGRISQLGLNGFCCGCLVDTDDYRRCAQCGLLVDSSETYWVENRDEYVCQDCVDCGDFRTCEYCDNLIDMDCDNDGIWTDDDCFYCCERCAERAGYHYSENRDCWTQDEEDDDCEDSDYDYDDDDDYWFRNRVSRYHSHTFRPITKSHRKNQKHPLFIGRETENRLDRDFRARNLENGFFSKLNEYFDNTCVYEMDGSVSRGFEIITQPMDEKAFFEMDWEKPFSYLREQGFRSHNTDCCGTHFHYSSWYLGYNNRQKMDSARKIFYFVEKYWEDIVKFSRRKEFGYCDNLGWLPNSKTPWDKLCSSRYRAVNVLNMGVHGKDTIEIRVCRGTLNTETMLASADFFLHIVRNAKKVPWKDIDNLSLWFKGIKKENTINYIKSRNCFEGAF